MNRNLKIVIVSAVLLIGTAISMFNHWEFGGESWGYWYFARVLDEGGGFVILGRSSLYTLYLNAFRWIGYPTSVSVEYLITTVITLSSIVLLFRRFLGLWIAVFASLLWVIFFQGAEPPVQKLALACSCFAVYTRLNGNTRFRIAISYAFLISAFMFRITYIVLIAIFILCDVYLSVKKSGGTTLFKKLYPKLSDWPLVIIILLFVGFTVWQSPHQWNNGYFGSSTWVPGQIKSLSDIGFIQHFNWEYIWNKYGTFKNHDYYFTNQELFNGADNMIDAVFVNPEFVGRQIVKNLIIFFKISASMMFMPMPGNLYLLMIVLLIISYSAFISTEEWAIRAFVIANILIVFSTIIYLPKDRYMFPVIPLLILSAYWFSNKVKYFLLNTNRNKIYRTGIKLGIAGFILFTMFFIYRLMTMPIGPSTIFNYSIYYIIIFLVIIISISGKYFLKKKAQIYVINSISRILILFFLVLFSRGFMDWIGLSQNIVKDISASNIRIMEDRPYSMKSSFKDLNLLVKGTKGIMALEHTFVGAFMTVPLNKVYDVWEIPPFGRLGDSIYNGLNPNRVDCLLISNDLSTGIGMATNYQIRYDNYIKPYADKLVGMGAKEYEIPSYGKAIIYKPDLDY